MQRPTIQDIARAAGVSKGAVSYALNGRPGVSTETRARILSIAEEIGWVPSSAARALSSDRAGVVGLVAVREPELIATEPYFIRMVAGVERTLAEHGVALLLTVVPDPARELDIYRRWWGSRQVDGMLLFDMRVRDPRPAWLRASGAPAVIIGAQRAYRGISATRVSYQDAMAQAVSHLVQLGHRRLARVSGPRALEHVLRRERHFAEVTKELLGEAQPQPQVETDYTARAGVQATRELLSRPKDQRPTAIIYDNDVMAAASVSTLAGEGVRVPADLAVLAWDDSPLCELVHPAVTAFTHDVMAEASQAADLLLTRIEHGPTPDRWLAAPRLTVRASTAGHLVP
ncbi:LacI family DNA-binding transcriptional regulator [Pseudonocardia acaciae]|uniref:LacI family DNA-binding transcriptional regulator n=1 Tax=Pseudonocardia acaciae TaxID=551276 RepID=UPI00048A5D67|nr:LacI family DNA-binding transcriptional regulator [Pseudonocardia acaciae]